MIGNGLKPIIKMTKDTVSLLRGTKRVRKRKREITKMAREMANGFRGVKMVRKKKRSFIRMEN